MKFVRTLATYVPGLIVEELVDQLDDAAGDLSQLQPAPYRRTMETVCMFCDVSGFTKLAEAMEKEGLGAEGLAKYLNQYFAQMAREIQGQGGDIFKYAGDAMIVLWPEDEDDPLENRIRRAAQAAITIQTKLHALDLHKGVQLSVKIGLGVGEVAVLFVGGVFDRMESVAVGGPLIQAFGAEHHGSSGQVIASKEVWQYLEKHYGYLRKKHKYMTPLPDDFVLLHTHGWNTWDVLTADRKMIQKRGNPLRADFGVPNLEQGIDRYVPGSVTAHIDETNDEEKWYNEVRRVATLFVNLGLEDAMLLSAAYDDHVLGQVQCVLEGVQKAVYQYEGSINKFLMDDKGSTLIACFGLTPNGHEDDAVRGVLAALRICERLLKYGFRASIGITIGDIFCGVVGSRGRREYSILGDPVNLSARLMQQAHSEGGGVICDQSVREACGELVEFQSRQAIKVKGKEDLIRIYHPYPERFRSEGGVPSQPQLSEPESDVYMDMHQTQLEINSIARQFRGIGGYLQHQGESGLEGRAGALTRMDSSIPLLRQQGEGVLQDVKRRSSIVQLENAPVVTGTPTGRGSITFRDLTTDREASSSRPSSTRASRAKWRTTTSSFLPYAANPSTASDEAYRDLVEAERFGVFAPDPSAVGNLAQHSLKLSIARCPPLMSINGLTRVEPIETRVIDPPAISRAEQNPNDALDAFKTIEHVLVMVDPALSSGSHLDMGAPLMALPPLRIDLGAVTTGAPTPKAPLPGHGTRVGSTGSVLDAAPVPATFRQLTAQALAVAQATGVLRHRDDGVAGDWDLEDVALVVQGTRLILPCEDIPCKWLYAFVVEGLYCRTYDAPLILSQVKTFQFSLCRRSELVGLTSRLTILHKEILLAKIRLVTGHPRTRRGVDNASSAAAGAAGEPTALTGRSSSAGSDASPAKSPAERRVNGSSAKQRPPSPASPLSADRDGAGSTLLVQGEPGVGKSHAVASSIARTLPGETVTLIASATSFIDWEYEAKFPARRELEVWGNVVRQHLDARAGCLSEDAEDKIDARTRMLEQEIRAGDDGRVQVRQAFLLNTILGTRCEEPAQTVPTQPLTGSRRTAALIRLMMGLLRRLASWRPTVILIDNAHFCDDASWALVYEVTREKLSLAVVMAMRPVNTYRNMYQRLSKWYKLAEAAATVVQLDGLSPELVEELVLRSLGTQVRFMTAELYTLVERMCLGIPSVVLGFLKVLLDRQLIEVKMVRDSSTSAAAATAAAAAASAATAVSGALEGNFILASANSGSHHHHHHHQHHASGDGGGSGSTFQTPPSRTSTPGRSRAGSGGNRASNSSSPMVLASPAGSMQDLLTPASDGAGSGVGGAARGTLLYARLAPKFQDRMKDEFGVVEFLPTTLTLELNLLPLGALVHYAELLDRLPSVQTLLLCTAAVLIAGAQDDHGHHSCRQTRLIGTRDSDGGRRGGCFPAKGFSYDHLEAELKDLLRKGFFVHLSSSSNSSPMSTVRSVGGDEVAAADAEEAAAAARRSGGAALAGNGAEVGAGGDDEKASIELGFAHVFMGEFLLKHMLSDNRKAIEKLRQVQQDELDRVAREKIAKQVADEGEGNEDTIVFQGSLRIHKSNTSNPLRNLYRSVTHSTTNDPNWKLRYAVLTRRGLHFFYRESGALHGGNDHRGSDAGAHGYESLFVDLTNFESPDRTTAVVLEESGIFGLDSVFTVSSTTFSKHGAVAEPETRSRSWHLAAENARDAKDWVYKIKFVIEQKHEQNRRAKIKGQEQTPEMSERARSNFSKLKRKLKVFNFAQLMWMPRSWGKARLAVHVREAKGLINPHNCGIPLCFVRLRLKLITAHGETVFKDDPMPAEERTAAFRSQLNRRGTDRDFAHEVVHESPLAHPPSSAPSWESATLLAGNVFVFNHLDAIDEGRMVSLALYAQVYSSEQMACDELIAETEIPLKGVEQVDLSTKTDQSQRRIEQLATREGCMQWFPLSIGSSLMSSTLPKTDLDGETPSIHLGLCLVTCSPEYMSTTSREPAMSPTGSKSPDGKQQRIRRSSSLSSGFRRFSFRRASDADDEHEKEEHAATTPTRSSFSQLSPTRRLRRSSSATREKSNSSAEASTGDSGSKKKKGKAPPATRRRGRTPKPPLKGPAEDADASSSAAADDGSSDDGPDGFLGTPLRGAAATSPGPSFKV